MELPELEHHLSTAFKLIKEQANALSALKDMIDAAQNVASQADQVQEHAIRSLMRKVDDLQDRIARIEASDFEEVRH